MGSPSKFHDDPGNLRYRLAGAGSLDRVRVDAARFRGNPNRARLVPPYLGVCAGMVLAASRMTADAAGTAGNYYERLWETLGERPQRDSHDFDYAPWLFRYLADWLNDDLGGQRGCLLVAGGGPAHIGSAINQCVFRERDKEHLAEFFGERVGRRVGDVDLLRLLQVSADRHRLTRRAQDAIADPKLQPVVRAALARTFECWDGTRLDVQGGRSWAGLLHLSVNHGLRLAVSAPDAPPGLDLGDGRTLDNRMRLGLDELSMLSEHGLRYGRSGEPGVFLPAAGDSLVFEVLEDSGLVWVRAPTRSPVYVMTRDRDVQRTLADYASRARGVGQLPTPWQLYESVPVEQLPRELGAPALGVVRPPVALAGGLRVGRASWLVGYPPRVEVGDVDRSLRVTVDGALVGEVAAGGERILDLPEGDHRVGVGDGLVAFAVHMLARNPAPPQWGGLRCSLDARGARTGASSNPADPTVCGATLSEPYDGPLPLMLRARTVLLITEAGVSLRRHAPYSPGWLAAFGIDPHNARWEVPLEDDIAWALTTTTAIAVRPVVPERLDRAATEAVTASGSRVRVRSLHRTDRDASKRAFAALRALAMARETVSQ